MNADVHALAGAYALNALPTGEAFDFRRHLAECPACRQEVHELQATAARLGRAAAELPPAELRRRVLQAVHRTRQVPPPTPPADNAREGRRSWPRWVAAAAAFVVIGGAGFAAVLSGAEDGEPPRGQAPVAAVMNAPDARSASARLRGGGSMTVVASQRQEKAVVLHEHLPKLPTSRVYQLWLVDPAGNARSADVLIEPGAGARGVNVIGRLRPGDRVAITREPAGGSERPSTAPLAVVDQA